MKLKEIKTNCETLLNKDGNDGYIDMYRWNTLLISVSMGFVRKKFAELFTITDTGMAIPKSTYSQKFIQQLVVEFSHKEESSYKNIPDNYLYWLNAYREVDGGRKELELVTVSEKNRRLSDLLAKPIIENPICYLSAGVIYFLPKWSASYDSWDLISYIRKPLTPFLDYYIDANLKDVFLDEDVAVRLATGEEYRDGTVNSGTKNSITQELEFPDDFHPEFQDMMIEKLSLPYDDQFKTQYAMTKQQMEDK